MHNKTTNQIPALHATKPVQTKVLKRQSTPTSNVSITLFTRLRVSSVKPSFKVFLVTFLPESISDCTQTSEAGRDINVACLFAWWFVSLSVAQ